MNRHALICDDEIHILRAAELRLRRAGFDVTCAHDGQEAWEVLLRSVPDVLVTDLQMPRLSGLQLAERVRGEPNLRHVPIVLLTAKGYELTEADVVARWGIARLISKPFSPRELLQIVEDAIRRAADAGMPVLPLGTSTLSPLPL